MKRANEGFSEDYVKDKSCFSAISYKYVINSMGKPK